jgi:hypothetical protein
MIHTGTGQVRRTSAFSPRGRAFGQLQYPTSQEQADLALMERALARTTPMGTPPGATSPPTRSSRSLTTYDYAEVTTGSPGIGEQVLDERPAVARLLMPPCGTAHFCR